MKLNRDPFRPELNNKRDFNAIGAPPKPSAKPRKPSRILCSSILHEDKENKETFSTQQRKTKRTRRQIRTYKVIIIFSNYKNQSYCFTNVLIAGKCQG